MSTGNEYRFHSTNLCAPTVVFLDSSVKLLSTIASQFGKFEAVEVLPSLPYSYPLMATVGIGIHVVNTHTDDKLTFHFETVDRYTVETAHIIRNELEIACGKNTALRFYVNQRL